ncbi:MAG: glycoside hydrolase family 10 protein [Muribaculaceae bacterium]
MRKNFIQLFIAVTAVFITQFNLLADDYPKQEFRCTWYCSVYNFEFGTSVGQSGMLDYITNCKNVNIHAIAFQARPMGDAMYPSSLSPAVPWSQYVSGKRGSNPGWDPLAYFVTQCHNLGMEAHVWINPYRMPVKSTWGVTTTYDTWATNNGWILEYMIKDNQNTFRILNPGIPEVRQHIADYIAEIVEKYDIDGVMFDDYFYAQWLDEYDNIDAIQYSKYGSGMTLADWRRDNVNKTVKLVYDRIKSIKPYVRFGIGPAGVCGGNGVSAGKYGLSACTGNDWMYDGIYCDPLAWLDAGTVDYLAPQVYWSHTHKTNPYKPIMQWYDKVANRFGRPVFSSNSIEADGVGVSEVGAQIATNRAVNTDAQPGAVLYKIKAYLSDMGEIANQYKYKSVPPAMTWYTATDPGKIASLSVSGSTLSCSGMSGVRYIFYAIPNNVSRNSAKSTNSNGLKAEYIVDMSYTNSVSISGKTSGYWYAVAPFDRYGNEWQLTTLNEPLIDPAPASTPISPATGSALKPSSITFTFSKVNVDSYKLQIASDINFSNMLFNQTISPNSTADGNYSYTYDGKSLADGDYYWRIVTSKDGYKDTNSSIFYFSVNNISEPCEAVTLLSPANGTVFNLGSIDMVFTDTQADTYVLHVAKNEDFTYMTFDSSKAPAKNAEGNLYFTGPVSVFPDGTYYWKVETSLAGYYNNESEVRTFVVNRPTLSSPKLISPANGNVLTEDGGTFTATDVDADAYKIEFSLYEDFSTILYSSSDFTPKGTQVSFSVSDIGMVNNTKHYWRVIASKDGGYHDGVSEKGYFTVALPGAKVSTIFYPENDFTFDCTDIVICASNPAGTTTKLEIADDSNFKNIVYSSYSYTVIDELGAPQYIIPFTKFSTGKYYFRMVTSQDGLKDGVSEVRYFNVIADDSNGEVTMENTEYPLFMSGSGGYFKFTNLWIKSNVLGNFFTSGNTQVNRDFAVRNINADGEGYVMVTYSSENSSSATKNILKFNALTGEQYSDMYISFPSSYTTNAGSYSQLNNIMVDDNQEVLVSNLALTSGKYLVLGKYNTSTGVVSSIKENLTRGSDRIDHTSFFGSISSGTSYLFGASNTNVIYRYRFQDGVYKDYAQMTTNSSLGTAPRMFIVDKDHFFIDGSSTTPEYYTWGNSTPSGSFDQASDVKPVDDVMNGVAYFTLGGNKFLAYSCGNYDSGVKFRLASSDNLPSSFSGLKTMWDFPEGYMGTITPSGGDKCGLIRIAQPLANVVYIYVFAPNNGLAAYKLEYINVTGVEDVFNDEYRPSVTGNELSFGFNVDNVAVYNSAGMLVAQDSDVSVCKMPDAAGIYIVVLRQHGFVKTYKIIK